MLKKIDIIKHLFRKDCVRLAIVYSDYIDFTTAGTTPQFFEKHYILIDDTQPLSSLLKEAHEHFIQKLTLPELEATTYLTIETKTAPAPQIFTTADFSAIDDLSSLSTKNITLQQRYGAPYVQAVSQQYLTIHSVRSAEMFLEILFSEHQV